MNKSSSRYINGTAALKPACSRYRNENERIISFETAAQQYHASHGSTSSNRTRARHARHQKKSFSENIASRAQNLSFVKDLKAGNIWGNRISAEEEIQVMSVGMMYTLAALATIAVTSI